MNQLKYDSLYSGLVSINKSLGGTQSMPDSEYGAMIDLMETLSGQPVGESGDAFDAVSTVATMAENGELPIQSGGSTPPKLDSVEVDITSNGRYGYHPEGYGLDGFSGFTANVNVPDSSRLGVKSVDINENGHQEFHAIDFDLDGFSTIGINVNVPTSGGGSPSGCNLGDESTNVTSNGTYRWDAVSFGLDGFSSFQVDINVPTTGGGGSDDKSWWYESGMTFAYSTIASIPSWFEPDRITSGTSFFDGATFLSTIGDLVFSNIYNAQHMFHQALSLENVGSFTINHEGCDVYGLFSECRNLSSIGSLNIKPNDCRYIFQYCGELKSVPLFDTSSAKYISGMFNSCTSLTTIPLFDFSSAEEATELFAYCNSLKTIPQFNFSKLQHAGSIFLECSSLESLPELDFGNVTIADQMFGWSEHPNLTTIGGFKNFKPACGNFIGNCNNLTVESLMNIINNLWDWSNSSSGVIKFEDGSEYDYGTDHSLSFGETNLAKLTDEQKAVATNKGWNLW